LESAEPAFSSPFFFVSVEREERVFSEAFSEVFSFGFGCGLSSSELKSHSPTS
jgi:hypothetical protein